MKANAATAIALDRVSKVYDTPVVSDVSLEIAGGSFVTLLGPSGSGKSTILQMIGGFVPPTSGRILFGAEDVTELPPNKRPCNTIFQDLGLFPHMTVAENVAYGLRLRGVTPESRKKRVADMLAIVALDGYEQRRVHQLSGGQRQRVALARALVLEPSVLLLDEPLDRPRRAASPAASRRDRAAAPAARVDLPCGHPQPGGGAVAQRPHGGAAGRHDRAGRLAARALRDAGQRLRRALRRRRRHDPAGERRAGWRRLDRGGRRAAVSPARRPGGGRPATAISSPSGRSASASARPAKKPDLGPVTVAGTAYKGRDIEVEATLPDGQLLKFLIPADQHSAPPAVGAVINLAWRPQRALLVAETGTAEP